MHNRRKSDESIEITAYILKYKTIDEQCIDDVSERVNFIEAEISKRRYSVNQHGAKENKNDRFVEAERTRLKAILRTLRKKLVESAYKREASSQVQA